MNQSTVFVNRVRENMVTLFVLAVVSAALVAGYIVFVPRTIGNAIAIATCLGILLYAGRPLIGKIACLLDGIVIPQSALLVSQKKGKAIWDTGRGQYRILVQEIIDLKESCGKLTLVRYGAVVWKFNQPLINSKAVVTGSLLFPNNFLERLITIEFDSDKKSALDRALSIGKKLKATEQPGLVDFGYAWIDGIAKEFDDLNAGDSLAVDEYFIRLKTYVGFRFHQDFGKTPTVTIKYEVM